MYASQLQSKIHYNTGGTSCKDCECNWRGGIVVFKYYSKKHEIHVYSYVLAKSGFKPPPPPSLTFTKLSYAATVAWWVQVYTPFNSNVLHATKMAGQQIHQLSIVSDFAYFGLCICCSLHPPGPSPWDTLLPVIA